MVGSIPNAEAAFRAVGGILDPRASRDGETGIRANGIGWQRGVFAARKAPFQTSERGYQFAPGCGSDELGFAREAIASFRRFGALRNDGVLVEGRRSMRLC